MKNIIFLIILFLMQSFVLISQNKGEDCSRSKPCVEKVLKDYFFEYQGTTGVGYDGQRCHDVQIERLVFNIDKTVRFVYGTKNTCTDVFIESGYIQGFYEVSINDNQQVIILIKKIPSIRQMVYDLTQGNKLENTQDNTTYHFFIKKETTTEYHINLLDRVGIKGMSYDNEFICYSKS